MKRILNRWSISRIVRLVIGVSIIILAIQMKMLMIGILGSMVLIQAIINSTCCDNGACDVKERK
ncbi:hypothetical protein FHW36_111156 [Chitinophaga polysaccharea]|uniref:DUF2892 family protein n=1 Tax=Chitinophaga polysaccharea TaxID=1293035 RepID=A0A561P770_9BACT|nr:hypothetical protein [Chitinophaga polysaccharea]TWF33965.1 hypothetical protein FHW36_111156 [Chitinophaga polysaccharea]